MKVVLLEGLGISDVKLQQYKRELQKQNVEFIAYEKNTDVLVQIERAKDADVILLANMPLKEEVIRACPRLKYIGVAFTGLDHIPMDVVKELDICVRNASGYATQAVAELTISFMIQLLRQTKEAEMRCRNEQTKEGLQGGLLAGRTVGIVGAGAIGLTVARLCKAFGSRVIACNPSKVRDESNIDAQMPLQELLLEADIVTLHCPLNGDTRNLLNAEMLSIMKPGAYLINTARGLVLDFQVLRDSLMSGRLAGAAVDVFDVEPPLASDHILLQCPNTIVTPHIAYSSDESMELRAQIVFAKFGEWLKK